MVLNNCRKCGKVITSENDNDSLCHDCAIAESKDLKTVTDYLRKFPLASIMEVAQKTNVSVAQLSGFVKNGLLKMRKAPEEFKCRLCGKEIKKGTVCDSCRSKIEGMDKNKR